jgi:signal peptidase I
MSGTGGSESGAIAEPAEPRAASPRASLSLRAAARLADSLLLALLGALCLTAAAVGEALGVPSWVWVAGLSAPVAIFLFYFVPSTRATGQTWGKRLAGIRVERLDGALLSQGEALSRALVDGIFELAYRFFVGLVDPLWALGRQRRTLHDRVARSVVVMAGPRRRLLWPAAALGLVAPALLILGLLRAAVVKAYFIPSEAMAPTLLPGDRVLANTLTYHLGPLRRGDVVVFHAPPQALEVGAPPKDFVKRVIGLPGDTVTIRAGRGVFANGKPFTEAPGIPVPEYDWPTDGSGGPTPQAYRVPAGHCFVLGDNRNQSNDSHRWVDPQTRLPRPELPLPLIVGKVTFRIYPDNRVGVVR